ncbi:MAG: FKBP-type peptidyl-prolyl cis-trans isomerase [Dokdonella sp.]|uniref:FKBP-type peptidyl-prolyl cis-trans isomerase n=1 Tax=Dokdonella sp. TaxID=2291710 RepID=UPI001B5096C0|nr:FKBP-type peptidyl-prolyl cis-trans isomerase [Dokdonella sp.]MCC6439842.1 FKBP-type peptidyl-prolyl cis-trans isomerase [Rhodanobacteraceae bacterium]MBK8124865.1 FKBP-type peptidyl-prolyl cis-trans isomerase [Dokdonella sp.]MBP6326208.1 FKBP-type peptidyl-prolyl cis-trans isomerase [Dokdonella sp.]MBP6329986.1 FKBP-type peptidyl-prolyl cis-trans isomerase [Dokdonella sp.]HNV07627.1 FKBP-type peptidyl-prolyl cis-trans isomerase [Dokdonella sp.]
MKFGLSLAMATLLAAGPVLAQDTTSEKGKLSYAIGYQIGKDFSDRKMDVDVNTVIRALQDAYGKRTPAISEEKMREILTAFQSKMMTEAKAEYDKVAATNKASATRFMSENKTKKGIVVLPSGLQYRVIEEGTGKQVAPTAEVTVHYRGSLSDGLEFDSSFARGEPVKFKVNEVIKGWQEALSRMKVGDHWQIFLPPDLAYGDRGQPPRIGPNQALVFDIKVISSN